MKKLLIPAAAGLFLAACQTAPAPAPEPIVEKVVERVEIIKEVQVETTPNLFILYTLKEGVTPEQFEEWVRETPEQWMWSNRRWS